MARLAALAAMVGLAWAMAGAQPYSWQEPQAKVLPTGDLEWAPHPFTFEKGGQVRYIDFASGDDDNPGTAAETPWKHHPWDPQAQGRAKAAAGADTYVFKRGVAYRGSLIAAGSGQDGHPIRLTSDPSWGEGEAALYGSERLAGPWVRCSAPDAPAGMPEPEKVWRMRIGTDWSPHALWEVQGDQVTRIAIAREPNWRISNPDDPQSEWYVWTGSVPGGSVDTVHLKQADADFFVGGYVWTEWSDNMGTIHVSPIEGYSPAAHALSGSGLGSGINGGRGNRYYIENVAAFLDEPGEYYHALRGACAGWLYLRLPGDRDPNGAVLEASRREHLIEVKDRSHIAISGLRFSFNDVGDPMGGWPLVPYAPTAVRIAGNCQDVHVANCRFLHVMGAVNAFPRMNEEFTRTYLKDMLPWSEDVMDDIAITDNDIAYCDEPAIQLCGGEMLRRVEYPPLGVLKRASVLRTRLYFIGNRPGSNMNTAIPALAVTYAELSEVAGNIVDRTWGAGIFVHGGKGSGDLRDVPLTRTITHHNKVTNAMLACNDYGGLEIWQGGSHYVYDNISGNAIGFKNYVDPGDDWRTVAYAFYFDGTFKSYAFNNIIWGKDNDPAYPYRNRGGYFTVVGFMDQFFNNTLYCFRHGIAGSSGNRSCFMGNIVADVSGSFIQQNRPGDTSLRNVNEGGAMGSRGVPTTAYGDNVFAGPGRMGNVGQIRGDTVEELRRGLADAHALLSQLGVHMDELPFRNAAEHDFGLRPDTPAAGKGVRFFVPWGLYATVGEWDFRRNVANPQIVLGENFYMTDEFVERTTYDLVPRNDLAVQGATAESYVRGPLEDWTDSALAFDGKGTAGVLTQAALTQDVVYPLGVARGAGEVARGEFTYRGSRRKTVDMDTSNFLIEVCFRAEPGRGGVLAAKAAQAGYVLDLDEAGRPRLSLLAGGKTACSRAGAAALSDGAWHHLIAEVDRAAAEGIRIYADGKPADGTWTGAMPAPDASLSNAADFLVGRGPRGDYFAGAMDYLRLARGTLADAKTTIGELYAWEFDGPFLRDFCGEKPAGKRDAGAIQFQEGR
jgi:hypothetical protein